jgi:hypothetical protein
MTDLFGDEVDVAPNRQRVWPIVAALIGVGLVFGGIASVVVTGGVNVWAVVAPLFAGPALPEVGAVEAASDVSLPAGTEVEPARDDSVYVLGQVRLPEGTGNPLEAGYVEVGDIPRHSLQVWNGELDDARYYIGAEGRSALTGENDGERVIVFYESD